jgi:hypothetical protein
VEIQLLESWVVPVELVLLMLPMVGLKVQLLLLIEEPFGIHFVLMGYFEQPLFPWQDCHDCYEHHDNSMYRYAA